MSAQVSTILLLLAALIGLFIGLLLSSLFSGKESRQKNQPPREIQKEGYGEVARLWYSPAAKKVLTEMDGGFYKGFSALSVEQQAKVKRLSSLLNDWTAAEQAVEPPVLAAPVIEERFQPVAAAPTPESDKMSYEQDFVIPAAAAVAPFATTGDEDADVVSVLQQSLEPEEEEAGFIPSPAAEFSITQQINAILQDILSTTELADKGIKLEENPDHGVDVFVGAEKYPGIEDVPYPQVRTLIHEAVLRWEQETDSQQRIDQ